MDPEERHVIKQLLEELRNPFVVFPFQSVTNLLSNGVSESQDKFSERSGHYGRSRKFWTVEMEFEHDKKGILIGSAFVLGQAIIVQTLNIANQIQRISKSPMKIASGKWNLLKSESKFDSDSNLSYLEIIETAANYFKHHYDWPADWHLPEFKPEGPQKQTVPGARAIGFVGHELTDNMYAALSKLGIEECEMNKVAETIQEWRENLAQSFAQKLGMNMD